MTVSEESLPRAPAETSDTAAAPKPQQSRRFSGLRAKLIVPYVLLTLLIAVVGVFVVTRLVTSSFQERFANQLREARTVAADGVVRRESDQLEIARQLAFTTGVPQAVEAGDVATLITLIQPVVSNSRPDAVAVIEPQGQAIVSFLRPAGGGDYGTPTGGDFSQEPIVTDVLRGREDAAGDKFVGLVKARDEWYLFTSAPIKDATEDIVGALLVGTRLTSLAEELEAQASAEVVLLDLSGKFMATTFAEGETPEVQQTLEAPPDLAAALKTDTQTRQLNLYNRQFQAAYGPLVVRQQMVGILGVALAGDFIVQRGTTSRDTISFIFAAGTLGMILIGYLLAQAIARPILRLRDVSQAVAGGDLAQQTGVRQSDEIGDLATAFDQMTDKLRERTQQIMERNEQLAEANAKLQAAQQQLVQSEKLAAVGQLTAGIVHDVKNPLAIISGLAEEIPEHADLDPLTKKHLTTIRDSARRASTIVTDLLKFARESTPDLKRQDLRDTVETVLRLTDYLARKAKVHVSKELPPAPALVMYDAVQIEQVLMNLVQNAIQAMPHGGSLSVRLEQNNEAVAVAVRDTGIGIPPKHLNRIFDPFFTTKPPGEGTGLGLSVSYGIVARHGGRIDVQSAVGEGTTFTVWLSANPNKASENGGSEQ
jgi:signal transduction histidine kinase